MIIRIKMWSRTFIFHALECAAVIRCVVPIIDWYWEPAWTQQTRRCVLHRWCAASPFIIHHTHHGPASPFISPSLGLLPLLCSALHSVHQLPLPPGSLSADTCPAPPTTPPAPPCRVRGGHSLMVRWLPPRSCDPTGVTLLLHRLQVVIIDFAKFSLKFKSSGLS